jgi:acetolactate synthase-1/2/3 large subunit
MGSHPSERECTVAAAVLDELVPSSEGVVFGIPGGAVSPIFDAMQDRPGIRLIIPKHESQGAFMALGYAQATGKPGIVFTTAGPGFVNALTGLASANAEGCPVVCVSGEVPKAAFGRGAVQEGSAHGIDVVNIAKQVTKFAAQVLVPNTASAIGRRAYATAQNGKPGPTLISMPLDVALTRIRRTPIYGSVHSEFHVDEAACRQAMDALSTARRPLLLVGSGARTGNGRAAVRALAERLRLPVIATTKGKGTFPEDHPLYLGVFGLGGHESVVRYLEEGRADVLLVCGSSLNDFATNSWSPLLEPTRLQIQVDIDAAQIGRNYKTDLGLLGRIDQVLPRITELCTQLDLGRKITPLSDVASPPAPGRDGRLSAQQAVAVINEACPAGTVFTCDMGEFLGATINFLRVRGAGDFLLCLGFGSMGSSIGTAIGYKVGAPTRDVVAICGDGSFFMSGNDIATAVECEAAITLCVINDGRLNMCHHGLLNIYGRTPDLNRDVRDIAGAARALGADGEVVQSAADLARCLRTPTTRARVLDIRIDPDVVLGGSQRVAALRHFTDDASRRTT